MSQALHGETFPMWRTPILCGQAPGSDDRYHAQLRRFILAERDRREGIQVGTVDAAKTQADLLRLSDPVIEPLRELVGHVAETMNKAVGADDGEMLAEAWAVVYDRRGYHRLHAHHDSAWSGVYYVSIGRGEAGRLELIDPRPAAGAPDPARSPRV